MQVNMSYDMTEQQKKRFKLMKEAAIVEIAQSVEHITRSIESMSENYGEILRINKNVVTYLQNAEKSEKGMNQTVADTERITIDREKQ